MHTPPLFASPARRRAPRRRASAAVLLALPTVVSACAGFATAPSDSSSPDASTADASPGEAAVPDATEPETGAPDIDSGAIDADSGASTSDAAGDASSDAAPEAAPPGCGPAQLECDGGCVSEDIANCGQCGKACSAPAHAVATCAVSGGQYACGSSCASGYSSCPTAGCVDLQTDNNNCGRCGHGCLGGTCSAGRCTSWQVSTINANGETLGGQRAGVYGHAAMATDGKNVVWIDATNGVLEKPLVGGSSTSPITLSPGSGSPYGWGLVAMAKGTVVWTTWDANNPVTLWSSKDSATLGGQMVTTIAGSTADYPTGLAIDAAGADVYIMDALNDNGTPANPGLYGCVLANSSCTLLHAVGASPNFSLGDDVAYSSGAFFSDTSAEALYRQSVGTIATSQANPTLLAVEPQGQNVYWVNVPTPDGGGSTFSIMKASTSGGGGPVSTVLPPQSGSIWGMTTDGVNVYFSNDPVAGGNQGGSLLYVPVGGGTPQSLKDGQQAIAVASGGGAIVWMDTKTNTINAIAAP